MAALGGTTETYNGREDSSDHADDNRDLAHVSDRRNDDQRSKDASEEPYPLRRDLPPPAPFPVEALSCAPALRDAAEAIQLKTQAPAALCGNSVLAAAALCAQAHGDVQMPYGSTKPLSLYLATVAESGERKSSVDDLAVAPIRAYEANLRTTYASAYGQYQTELASYTTYKQHLQQQHKKDRSALRAALAALGREPNPPPAPLLLVDNPTVEGLEIYAAKGQPSFGLFTAEGGKIIGGYLLNDDNKMKAGATLNGFWDGTPLARVRKDSATKLPGRRLSMHVMVQPGVALSMLSDPTLMSLGTLSRLLVVAPASAAGNRLWREMPASVDLVLREYHDALMALLSKEPQKGTEPNELDPPALFFAPDARAAWIDFYNETEVAMRPDANWAPIKGLAAKLPEHAARIAGVMALVNDPNANEITVLLIEGGIALARYYAGEALRLFENGAANPDIVLAERLLAWLQERPDDAIYLAKIYQSGPRPIRDKGTAARIVAILEDHGWLRRFRKPQKLDGAIRRDAWRLSR